MVAAEAEDDEDIGRGRRARVGLVGRASELLIAAAVAELLPELSSAGFAE